MNRYLSNNSREHTRACSAAKYVVISKNRYGIFLVRRDPRNAKSPMIVKISSNAIAVNEDNERVQSKKLLPGDQVYVTEYEPNYFAPHQDEEDALYVLTTSRFEYVSVLAHRLQIDQEVTVKHRISVILDYKSHGDGKYGCKIMHPLNLEYDLHARIDWNDLLRKFDVVSFDMIELSRDWLVSDDQQIVLPPEYRQFADIAREFPDLGGLGHFIIPMTIRHRDELEKLVNDLYSNVNFGPVFRAQIIENLLVMGNNIYEFEETKITNRTRHFADVEIEREIDNASVELKASMDIIRYDEREDRGKLMKAMIRYRPGARMILYIGSFKYNVTASYVDMDKQANRISVYFQINKLRVEKNGQSLEHQINRKQWEIQLKPYQLAKAKLISCLKGGLLSNIASAEDPTPAQMMIAQLTGIECKVSSRLNDMDMVNESLLVAIRQQLNEHQNRAITKIVSPEHPLVVVQTSPGCGRKVTLRAAIKICAYIYDYVIVTSSAPASIDKFAKTMAVDHKRPLLLHTFHKNVNRPIQKLTLDYILKDINCDEKFESKLSEDELKIVRGAVKLIERRSASLRGPIKRETIKLENDEILVEEEDEPEFESLFKSINVALKFLDSNIILGSVSSVSTYCRLLEKNARVAILVIDGGMLLTDALFMLNSFEQARKMVIFGDTEQFYRDEFTVDEKFRSLICTTALEGSLRGKKAANEFLRTSYKFHPLLFNAISKFAYKKANLECEVSAETRQLLTNSGLGFANKDSPIILVDVDSKQTRETRGYSNKGQEKIAFMIYDMLKRNSRSSSCIVISPYAVTRLNLVSKGVADSDSFTFDKSVYAEADIAIIVTVKTDGVSEGRSEFIDTEKRINTVITRAKHGLIVIGDLDYLDDLTNWHKALNILRKDGRAHKVTGEQIRRWHTEMPLPAPTNVRRPRVKREAAPAEHSDSVPAKKIRPRIKVEPETWLYY